MKTLNHAQHGIVKQLSQPQTAVMTLSNSDPHVKQLVQCGLIRRLTNDKAHLENGARVVSLYSLYCLTDAGIKMAFDEKSPKRVN